MGYYVDDNEEEVVACVELKDDDYIYATSIYKTIDGFLTIRRQNKMPVDINIDQIRFIHWREQKLKKV